MRVLLLCAPGSVFVSLLFYFEKRRELGLRPPWALMLVPSELARSILVWPCPSGVARAEFAVTHHGKGDIRA